MSRVVVDLDGLAELVERMQRFQAQLTRARTDVDARVQALHATWTGSAASAQAAVHAQWRTGAVEAQEALAVLRSIATGAHENYASAVHANRRMWAG